MDIEFKENSKNEKNNLVEDEVITLPNGFTYTTSNTTNDGLMDINTQLKHIEYMEKQKELTKSELDKDKEFRRDMTKKVIFISLCDIGLNPFTNTYNMSCKDRDRLQKQMRTYEDVSIDEITDKFNDLCNDKVFENPKFDYSKTPIYDI